MMWRNLVVKIWQLTPGENTMTVDGNRLGHLIFRAAATGTIRALVHLAARAEIADLRFIARLPGTRHGARRVENLPRP
jgi:hypothetical protein